MKPVLVRFAGAPDAAVRRRAIQLGRILPAGQRRAQVFQGYIITVVGRPERAIATCLELGVEAVALFGNFLLNDMFNSPTARVRLPSYARFRAGGESLPPSEPPTVPPAAVGDIGQSRVPTARGPRAFVAGYWNPDLERSYGGSPSSSWGCWPVLGSFFWSAAQLVEEGVVHGACAPMPYGGLDVQQQLPDTPWMGQARFVWSQVHVRYLSLGNPRGVSFTDGWLSHVLGSTHYVSGRGISSNYFYTQQNSVEHEESWRVLGATPLPRFYGDDPQDGQLTHNYYPHQITRDNAGAMVQPCYPVGYPTDDGGMLVAVTCEAVELADYLLYLDRAGEDARQGYISTLSLVANWGATAPCFSPGAGTPKLALLRFGASVLSDLERKKALAPTLDYVVGERRAYLSNGVASYSQQTEDSLPPEDRAIPYFQAATAVSVDDLPAWAHPMPLSQWRDLYIAALDTSQTAQDRVRITSDHRMSAVFGTVHQTVVGDVVEYVFAVRARAGSLVPITRERRAAPDEILPGEQAAVMVTKTGLAVVRASLDGTVISTDLWFPDVVGPADCSQFDPTAMDPLVAKVPQVKFSAVMGGRRVYVCRVVRYARTPFLASLMGAEGTMRRETYSSGYQGRRDSGVGGPTFNTDRAFGPYPDRAQLEETWIIVDGVRHVLNPIALGGFLEPFTDRKFPHAFGLRYTQNGVLQHPYFVHMYGMWSAEDEQDRVLMDYMVEEFAPSGYEVATVAQISDTALAFVLCPMLRSSTTPLSYTICRYDINSRETTVLYQGAGPWPAHWLPPRALDWAPALTCYQREVLDDQQQVRTPAHLLLRVGMGDEVGVVSTSIDGGYSWEMLYTNEATQRLYTSGEVASKAGTPGLGLHILGRTGAGGRFQFLIDGGG